MVRTRLALLVVLCLVVAPAVSPSAGATTEDLTARLTKSLHSPYVALDRTGAIALDAATGEVLYGHNETLPLVPASNEKLPVAWTALILLGPAYRFHTDVVARGKRLGATWNGDLFITGNGDPTLTGQDIGRLAAAVRAAGIRRITGRIRGDESAYDARRGAPGWKHYFIGGESPPLSALVVDRARGWPALSPPLLAAKALRAALVARGVAVAGRARPRRCASQGDDDCRRPLAKPRVHRPGDGPRQRQLRRGDAAQAPRDARRRRGDDRARRARRARRDADRRHPGQGRSDRRRLRAVVARPADTGRSGRRDPCGDAGPADREGLRRVLRDRRPLGNPRVTAAAPHGGGAWQDRDDWTSPAASRA